MLPLSLPPNGGWAEIGACPRSSSSLLSLRRHRGYTDVFTRGRTPWGLLRHPQGGHWSLVKRHFRNVGFVNFLTFHAQTIQNRHFVIIPRIRAAQGAIERTAPSAALSSILFLSSGEIRIPILSVALSFKNNTTLR